MASETENMNTPSCNKMEVSGTESGYLTDSFIMGKEKNGLQDSSGEPASNSENDITPCAENLMAFSDSSGTASPQNSETGNLSCNGTSQNYEGSEESNRNGDLHSLPSLDINELKTIDEIFTSNFSLNRPESLPIKEKDNSANKCRSKSDIHSGSVMDSDHASEGRKRSKSSGFPIPKQKEGVLISEELLSKSLPHGKVVKRETGMIEFIADDLQEMIRMSSPISKTASEVSSRRSSDYSITSVESMASSSMATSMTSGMSRSSFPQSPDCIPPIDPIAVHEIENQARLVAENLDQMMSNLHNNLHKMSAISVGCEEAYKTSVDVTCDSVDSSIKSMYAMMAKCEELSSAMLPVYKLNDQIKDIKRLLDRFEDKLHVAEKPS
ncbi:BLOC-1-related complex subunit 6-like [Mya arenaria]|nr:BLOC-1-related complex subunit 6-like [Mya arenaria]XP_052781353.1 BLOC-1-related complex subunit 6-like [Mya arenaria]XP_052781354.1 BLOC-1-related complex subunit 6-like [Mya arenaria]XP_052781355.1 BLOC-1-related complex subunit 6-like [Mya arenaria]XP_052781356.1 BLOC-1-related complex subunit 6-like [Mya arenaria]XP_052781357.1 BLOC-1-related complex subunit 6-like [Mya arenaria]